MTELERWIYALATAIAVVFIWIALNDLLERRGYPDGCVLVCDVGAFRASQAFSYVEENE